MNILMSLLSNSGYIIVNKEIIKKLGLHEAIVLGELCSEYCYWENNNKLDNGYFFSTRENIEKSTGLSAYQQREAFKRLVQIGIVLEKLKGMPQQKWYSLDVDKLYNLFCEDMDLMSSSKKIRGQEVKKIDTKPLKNLTPSNEIVRQLDVKKFSINNNNNNNKNINNKEEIKKFKDRIYMTNSSYQDLIERYGKDRVDKTINRLDLYKKSSGKNYCDDYSTILLWIDEDIEKEKKSLKQNIKEDSIWIKDIKEKYGDNLEGLYANYGTTNN